MIRQIQALWVALVFMRQPAVWRPLSEHSSPIEAGRACVRAFQEQWNDIAERARSLRALTEHPSVAGFVGDGIDGRILTRWARELSLAIECQNENIARLLDEPRPGDRLQQDDKPDRPDDGGDGETATDAVDVIEAILTAPEHVLAMLHQVFGDGKSNLVATLVFLEPGLAETDAPLAQELVDGLFIRAVSDAVLRLAQHCGTRISPSAIEQASEKAQKTLRGLAERAGVVQEPLADESTPVMKRKPGPDAADAAVAPPASAESNAEPRAEADDEPRAEASDEPRPEAAEPRPEADDEPRSEASDEPRAEPSPEAGT